MPPFRARPVFRCTHGVVTAGHYLAAAAGLRVLQQGGNAIDAAAATCFALNLVEPQNNGLGGEAPTLVYVARERRAYAISGMGWSPAALTIDWCRQHGIDLIPGDGFLPACVPAVVDTWATALARFGRLSFGQVLAPATELAEEGFPVDEGLHGFLHSQRERFVERYPSTAEVYCPGGRAPETGERLRNPAWAGVLRRMADAERDAAGKGRAAGIEAARDVFYRGPVAERIVAFSSTHAVADATGRAHRGLLAVEDFAEWRAAVEEPVSCEYAGLEVHKCSSWTQGPVFLQQLRLLEGFDLAAMGHNSATYLHTLIECAKLAFADREAYYGDPVQDEVPLELLLSAGYAERRRTLVGETASREMRPGDAGRGLPDYATFDVRAGNRAALGIVSDDGQICPSAGLNEGDTTHLDIVDGEGNMVSATPSGGWLASSPVIPGLGFPLGTRGQMFYLDRRRPNALAPRKRPRATLTPTLVTRRGEPCMVFGTPGGDNQDQWTLQFFLNAVTFGMDLQRAVEAPLVHSEHVPSSFHPRAAHPGRMVVESRVPDAVVAELESRGHEVVRSGPWDHGRVMGIRLDRERGSLEAGVSPRGETGYAMGW